MKEIFISYRRADDPKAAHLLEKCLCENFGKEAVFLDADDIELGSYFDDTLVHAIQDCKVVVAMIGKNWRGEKPNQDRFTDAADWVRKELSLGLTLNKIIIPVLLENCEIKKSFSYLPEELQNLPRKNAVKLRDLEFQTDIAPLITAIASYVDFEDPLINLPLPKKDRLGYPNIPFKGLAFFTEKDARCFHGRGKEIESIFYKIENSRVIFFYGNSGVGKSSLLYAGLFPRLKNQNWEINYIRRNPSISTSEVLNSHFQKYKKFNSDQMHLVILDQIEEIFTNPTSENNPEKEASILFREILKIAQNSEWRFIVSFRSEYLAQLEDIYVKLLNGVENEIDYKQSEFYFNKFLLKPISAVGISEAILGITKNKEIKNYFSFDFENKVVPLDISKKVVFDEKANVAPWLQVILRKMWDEVEDNSERIFSKDLLDRVSNDNFEDFVTEQINNLKDNFPEAYHSGLVLDVLHFFITERITSQSRSLEEIKKIYSKRAKVVLDLVDALKNKYLLSENMDEKTAKVLEGYRLSHDTLAPIINRLYINSTLPGQRAAAILSSKRKDFENKIAVEFSKADLKILEAGKLGMRAWTDLEEDVFQENLERVSKEEKELEEKNIELGNRLARNYWEMGKRAKYEKDYSKLLHLHGKALEVNKEKQLDNLIKSDAEFFYPEYRLGIRFAYNTIINGACLNQNKSRILTWNTDKMVRLWDCETGEQIGKSMNHENDVIGALFNQSECRILTWTNKIVRLWASNTGEQVGKNMSRGGFGDEILFNKDGSRFFTLELFVARLWDSETGKQIGKDLKYEGFFGHAIFNPDGSLILTWCKEGNARLLDCGTGELVDNLMKHKGGFRGAIFNGDGSRILTWGEDGTARLWDIGKLPIVGKPIELQGYFDMVIFNTDGNFILTQTYDGTVRLWNSLNGEQIGIPIAHEGKLNEALFTNDSRYILTWSNNTARLWDSRTGEQIGHSLQHQGKINGATFNIDENRILTWSYDGAARLWSIFTTYKIGKDMVHEKEVYGANFNSEGNRILTWSKDGKVRLWDSWTGIQIGNSISFGGEVGKAFFSLDGSRILTWGRDGVRFWKKANKYQEGKAMKIVDEVTGALFNTEGSRILIWSTHGPAKLWDSRSGEYLGIEMYFGNGVNGVLFNKEGSFILTWSEDKTAKIWEIITGEQVGDSMKHTSGINGALFNRDESYVLTWSKDKTAKIWENKTGKQVGKSMVHDSVVEGALFKRKDSRILTWCYDGTARLWDTDSTDQVGKTMSHLGPVKGAIFNKDEDLVLTWSQDKMVRLWDGRTGEKVGQELVHETSINGAKFNRDAHLILTWSDDGARLWDSRTYKQVGNTFQKDYTIFGALFDENESHILVYGLNEARLWEIETEKQVGKTMEHQEAVFGAEFNQEGSRILTWDYSGSANLWDSRTGERIGKSMEHGGWVNGAIFNPDQSQILTWSADGTAKLWNIEADLDFPPEHFSLQVEVLTGTTLNMNTLEVEVMEPEVWKTKKEQYEKLAREHYKVCKHPKANWWAKFNPEEAKKLRLEVE